MLQRARWIAGVGFGLVVWGIALLPGVSAQTGQLPSEGIDKLEKAFTRDQQDAVKKMFRGELDPAGQDEAIDNAAKWYSYQVTWNKFQNQPTAMHELLKRFDKDVVLDAQRYKGTNDKFIQKFTKQMIVRLKEVLLNDTPIARVNGADLLERLASIGQEETADALLEILNDPKQNGGVKLHAVQGLQKLFELNAIKDKARETKCILALLKLLDDKPPVTAETPLTEVDGYRWFRCKVVKALGASRYPGVLLEGKLGGRTAQALLRVLNNDGIVPYPLIDEQFEAAVGVASLKPQLTKGYQPDYAAEQLGRFVVELASQYQTDMKKDSRPWKVYSAHLQDALEAMKADAGKAENKDAAAYVNAVANQCMPVFKVIDAGKDALMAQDKLRAWLDSNPAKNTTVYAGLEDSKVKPFQRQETELKEKPADTTDK